MTKKIDVALNLAKYYHSCQRYGDKDYFNYHIINVVYNLYDMKEDGIIDEVTENHIIVAYLHDILEDTCISHSVILDIFGKDVYESVKLLTKSSLRSRQQYLQILLHSKNKVAIEVKISDAQCNMGESYQQGDDKRMKYYKDTIDFLLQYKERL